MVKKKIPKLEFIFLLVSFSLALSFLTFYVWYQTEVIRLGMEIRRAEETINRLQEEIKTLEAIRSSLLSLERVERIARDSLRLNEPDPSQIIYENFEQERKQ